MTSETKDAGSHPDELVTRRTDPSEIAKMGALPERFGIIRRTGDLTPSKIVEIVRAYTEGKSNG